MEESTIHLNVYEQSVAHSFVVDFEVHVQKQNTENMVAKYASNKYWKLFQ
jgi:hypothetical protein